MRILALFGGLLGLGMLSGCGGGGAGSPRANVTVKVVPNPAYVLVGKSTLFGAQVSGASTGNVTWKVQEGAAGGTITAEGIYTAPAAAGIYHVVATSKDDSRFSGTGVVNVVTVLLASVTLNLQQVTGGGTVTGTVSLADVAAAATTVTLSANGSTDVTIPASVTIPAGGKAVPFTITTNPVTSDKTVVITATQNGVTVGAQLQVLAPQVVIVSANPLAIKGGGSSTGTIALNSNAPKGGTVVALETSNPAVVTVPANATVAEGTSSITFPITTTAVTTNTFVLLSATAGGQAQSVTIKVTP